MSIDSITLLPRTDATKTSSQAAVARCYAYLVERGRLREQKEGGPSALENAKERIKGDFRAEAKSNP